MCRIVIVLVTLCFLLENPVGSCHCSFNMANKRRKGFNRIGQSVCGEVRARNNRSSSRMQWTEAQMTAAMASVFDDGVSGNKAAAMHGVPPSTLKDRLSGRVTHGDKPGPKPYMNSEEEQELTAHLIEASSIGYGKTRRDVLNIVEKYVEQKENMSLRSASVTHGWWQKFLKRNPDISLRRGDSTAGVRLDAVNAENLSNYFDLLRSVFDEHNFDDHPEAIYNMDETGVPLEPRPPKVIAKKGQKKVRYQTSGQKQQITVIGCGSATGQCIPPFIIFAAKQVNHLWTRDGVSGSRYAVSDKGWIDHDLFFFFLKEHFIAHAVSHRPLLLLLDGHSTHFDPMSLQFAKDNGIIIFCLPPHTTHECQPLDCSLFKPLKDYWRRECHKFYSKNPGKVINKLNFCGIFRNAWLSAITPGNIVSGFRTAGVYPFNRDAISCLRSPVTEGQGCIEHAAVDTEDEEDEEHGTSDEGDCESICETTDVSLTFSREEELKYVRRFEEGYDLFDARYDAWLSVYHPDVVRVSNHETPTTSSDVGLSVTSTDFSLFAEAIALHSVASTADSAPLLFSQSTPNRSETTQCNPTRLSYDQLSSSSSPSTPIHLGAGPSTRDTVKRSPLSELVNIPSTERHKSVKTGNARVLTSNECLRIFKEKEEKKRLAAEEKQRRKNEREQKKRLRDEEAKRKEEAKVEKAALRDAKKREKEAMQLAKQHDKGFKRQDKGKGPTKRKSDYLKTSRPQKKARDDADEEVDDSRCCVCFGTYADDAGTDHDWVMCSCGRWLHEGCVDSADINSGTRKMCPLC